MSPLAATALFLRTLKPDRRFRRALYARGDAALVSQQALHRHFVSAASTPLAALMEGGRTAASISASAVAGWDRGLRDGGLARGSRTLFLDHCVVVAAIRRPFTHHCHHPDGRGRHWPGEGAVHEGRHPRSRAGLRCGRYGRCGHLRSSRSLRPRRTLPPRWPRLSSPSVPSASCWLPRSSCFLARCFVLQRLVVGNHAEIMVGKLQVILLLHPVPVVMRVLRQLLVLVEQLRSVAAGAAVDPVELVATTTLLPVVAATTAVVVLRLLFKGDGPRSVPLH